METIEIKPTEIICLQTNDTLLELDFLRKSMNALFEYKNYATKLFTELNLVGDDKQRFEFERIENRFADVVRGNEGALQRYLQEDGWATASDEFSTTLQTICDPNAMDCGDVTQAYTIVPTTTGNHMVAVSTNAAGAGQGVTVDSLNSSYNSLGEKKDVMAIAAAEVVMHSYRDGLYICGWPSCEYQTSSRRHINNHKLVHTGDGEFNCSFPECGRRFKSREELQEHAAMHQHDHPYPCVWPGCDFRSQTPATLKAHMRVHMDRKFKCELAECGEEFLKITEYNQHRRLHENGVSSSTPGTPIKIEPQQQDGQTSQQTIVQVQQQQQQQQQQAVQQVQQSQQVLVSQQQHQQIAQLIAANSQGHVTIQPQQLTTGNGQHVTLIQLQQPPSSNVGTAIAHKTIVAAQQNASGTAQSGAQSQANTNPNAPQPITTAIAVAGTNAMINTQLFKCNTATCNALFSTLYDLKQHMMQHSKVEKPFRCDYNGCEYSAYTKTALNEHKITHSNERNYVCPVENCGRRYKTRKGLWDHSHTHRPDKPYVCTFPNCTYRCVSSSYLRSHMRAHKDPNSSLNSANNASAGSPGSTAGSTTTNTAAGNTIQAVPQVVPATQNQQFYAPGTIVQHPNGTQEFYCGIINCGKSFDNQTAYLNHVKTHAPTLVQSAAPTAAVTAQVVATPTPPRNRSRNPELARFKCEFEGCNAAYKLKRNLKDHMIRHTILEKPYRCDWPGCDYGSYKSTNVAKHKSVHSDERKYGCDYYNCDKKFKTREGLRKHMLSHHKPSSKGGCGGGGAGGDSSA